MGGAHGKPLWILPEEAASTGGYSDGVVTYEGFRVLGFWGWGFLGFWGF